MRQMVALKQLETDWAWPEERPEDNGKLAFLNHLRFVSLACRARSRTDLFEACALLSVDRNTSFRAHAEALMLCLNDALEKRAVLFRPGTEERSFDEEWLLRLTTALAGGDEASATFLLHSRVVPEHRRLVRFLLSRISEQFSLT